MTLDEILVEIKNAQNIVVMAHEAPDGDAIGSALAMCLALKNMGKNPVYLLPDEFPANFNYLPGLEFIKKESEIEVYDMAIALDCPNIKRLRNENIPYFENAKVKVEIDHHNKNDMFVSVSSINAIVKAELKKLNATNEAFMKNKKK